MLIRFAHSALNRSLVSSLLIYGLSLLLLSRSKVLNRTTKNTNTADRVIDFGASDFQRAKMIDFPNLSSFASVRNKDGAQSSFIYEAETPYSKTRYHIPQLELARSLFLINSYFCRSCLSSTALQQEFDVQYEVDRKSVV